MRRHRGYAWGVVVATVLAGASAGLGQDMAELEVDHALTFDYPTPHTDWAQPYARGKTRVLFFTDGRGTRPRECVEVMQRFELEAEAVFWARIVDSTQEHWHGGNTGERRLLGLLDKEWDCFVFLEMGMSQLSPEQQVKILRPVVEGAGILFVGSDDKRVLKEGNQIPVPPDSVEVDADTYSVGGGRGARLPRRPEIGYREGWEVEYDYWSERLGRTILWVAGNEPDSRLELSVPGEDVARGLGIKVAVSLSGKLHGRKPVLTVRARRPADDPLQLAEQAFGAGQSAQLTLPLLPAGAYHIDVWVTTKKGVETWATVPVTISPARTIPDLELTQDWGEVGDTVQGVVRLEGDPLQGESVLLRLMDRHRRVLVRETVEVRDNAAAFSFTIEPWMPMLLTVEALLMQDGVEVCRTYRYVRVTKRHQDRFNFLIWDTPRGTLAPYAEESLAKHSMTLQLGHGSPSVICAAYDVAWVPYTTRIMAGRDADGVMKPFCWNDGEAVAKHVKEKAEAYLPARRHGVFVWSLGDEVQTLGSCLSPHCARAYRAYLKEQYSTVSALNDEWGASFASWDAVGLSKADDPEEAQALQQKNYPRWFDRQAYKSWNFVQFCRRYAEAYEAIDPKAKTGFEGAGRFERGDDLDLIVRSNKFWSPYPGTADEVIRSIAPRHFPRANWMGYTKDADTLLLKYWRMVTRGTDAVWWWRWDCIGRFHGWLAPDFRPFPAVQEILADTQVVRDGLGDLLLKSTMVDDRIAILYSYPSSFAHKLDEGGSYGGYEAAHLGAQLLVRELGMQFRYVTDRMLRLGEFDAKATKLLILPRIEALGDREADVIRQFVEGGGTVLADARVGIYDGHCKARPQGVLDDLFGVRRTGRPEMTKVEDPLLGTLKVDMGVEMSTSVAERGLDGIPTFITKQTGKGRTILLNFDLSSLPKLGLPDTSEGAAHHMMSVFYRAGTLPRIRVLDGKGERERNVELVRWQNGSIEILALFRQGGQPSKATLKLAERRHVYDLRDRRSLGREKSFGVRIVPSRATFLVLCPGSAPEPEISLPAESAARGTVVKATLRVPGAAGLHALRLRARAGDTPLAWLDRNVIVGDTPVEVQLPIAHNDPEGRVDIEVIDLFTDEAESVRLEVR